LPISTLLQVAPDIWDYVAGTATANDDLLAFGDSYAYFDHFGSRVGGAQALDAFLTSRAAYWDKVGIRQALGFASDWDSNAAIQAYGRAAQALPHLRGLFILQYLPYAAGQGRILWAKRPGAAPMPVLSALTTVRNDFNDGACSSPQEAIDAINQWAARPAKRRDDRFTWVSVLAWSEYDLPADAPDLADHNGKLGPYQAAAYIQRHLDAGVKVVTPAALLELLNSAP